MLRGLLIGILFTLNIIILPTTLLILAVFKFLIPIKAWHRICYIIMHEGLTPAWVGVNSWIISLLPTKWDIQGKGELKKDDWYLVLSNHQNYLDILILQKIFNRKIPILKFFMKQELLWTLPFAGLVCWALNYPFMKRYTPDYLKKHPEKKGKDVEATIRACEKFRYQPTTIANFVEGTRFTQEKHDKQNSPYQFLLKPKAGGIASALYIMKDYMRTMVNVTIVYSDQVTFWEFMCGKLKKVTVRYEVKRLPDEWFGDYAKDQQYRRAFHKNLAALWKEKDEMIAAIKQSN